MKINAILPNFKKTAPSKVIKKNAYSSNDTLNQDMFLKNSLSFSAKFNSHAYKYGYMPHDKLALVLAKEHMRDGNSSWKRELYNVEYKAGKRETGQLSDEVDNRNSITGRIASDALSWGTYELYLQYVNYKVRRDIRSYIDDVDVLIADLKAIEINEREAEMKKVQEDANREIKYLEKLNHVKEGELYQKLIGKIQAKREGRNVEVPNCIMLSNKNDEINKELINWCMNRVNGNSVEVDIFDDDFDFVEYLENLEERYKKTKDWNLVYVKNMDKAINPNIVNPAVIASMKAIMCSTAEDYHSTLIFSSTNPNELDDTAIESNRVTKINADELETLEEMKTKDMDKKLHDKKYLKEYPMAAMNYLVDYAKLDKRYRLTILSDKRDLNITCARILFELPKEQREKYKPVLEDLKKRLWYCADTENLRGIAVNERRCEPYVDWHREEKLINLTLF